MTVIYWFQVWHDAFALHLDSIDFPSFSFFLCLFAFGWYSAGGDDRRVLLWKLEESMAGISEPRSMKNHHYSNIFCLAFNNDSTKILSGGNDDAVIVHDVKTYSLKKKLNRKYFISFHFIFFIASFNCSGEPYDVFLHSKPVYSLSVDSTNDQIFSTAGEDGHVLVYDLRIGVKVLDLAKSRATFHAVQFHPMDGNFAVTGNGKDGAALWDLREYSK